MESPQIWTNIQEKFAHILVLHGQELHHLKVSGMALTFKRKVQGVLEALQQGKGPEEAGAKLVQTFPVGSIGKATVSPGNGSLTLYGQGDSPQKLAFSPNANNADEILAAILARSGRTFRSAQEDIGVVEAVLPPGLVGLVGGLLWMGVHDSARKMAAGEAVEVRGVRRRGLQRMLIGLAEALGPNGTMAAGVVLLALVLGWAALRIVRRPQRTAWLPEGA